jgi:hypothetical protein
MTETTQDTKKQNTALQLIVIGVLLLGAFFGAFKFASARSSQSAAPVVGIAQTAAQGPTAPADGATPACACCSGSGAPTANGVTGDPVEGTAKVAGDVQAIAVEVGATYSPNIIKLKAGVPAEITFGQSSGCTAQVVSQELGFSEDLTSGPRTVKLPALEKGEYSFSCGMQMVFGKIVVE